MEAALRAEGEEAVAGGIVARRAAAVGARPQRPVARGEERQQAGAGESFPFAVSFHPGAVPGRDAAATGAEPDFSIGGFGERVNIVAGQPVLAGEITEDRLARA